MKVCITGRHETELDSDAYIASVRRAGRKEFIMRVDFSDLTPLLSSLDVDIASIAAGLFKYEGLFRNQDIRLDGELTVVLCQSKLTKSRQLADAISDIVSFTLHSRPRVNLHKSAERCATGPGEGTHKLSSVCLFSGGIDSLSGILKTPPALMPTAGVFVSHDRMASLVRHMQEKILNKEEIPIHKIGIQRGHLGYQQMRGFTYLVMGAVVAKIHKTDNIIISETGQTMFLPPMGALDEITMTTHPTLIEITKSLLRESYGIEFKIYEPFSDLTKAEVVSLCNAKGEISSTNSCITTRFANQEYSHCGKCFGCLVRRIGCLVAGVNDARYAKDVLAAPVGSPVMGGWPGKTIRAEDLADLQALLRLTRDVIEDKLDETARFKISSFSKEDLFRRASMDVLAALHIMYDQTRRGHSDSVRRFYEECKKDKLINLDIAQDRIGKVREAKYKPDFENFL